MLNIPYTHLYEQRPSLSLCCEVTQNNSQDFSLGERTITRHMIMYLQNAHRISYHAVSKHLTSYLYCSKSNLWVMTNSAFLFFNTRFPIIRPKASGLKRGGKRPGSLQADRKHTDRGQKNCWLLKHTWGSQPGWDYNQLTHWQPAPVQWAHSLSTAVERSPAASSKPSATPCPSVCRPTAEEPELPGTHLWRKKNKPENNIRDCVAINNQRSNIFYEKTNIQ